MERRPDPEPLETNDVALVTALTALWAIAGVVLVMAKLADADIRTWWLQMCAYGVVLGLIGVRTCRRRHEARERDGR